MRPDDDSSMIHFSLECVSLFSSYPRRPRHHPFDSLTDFSSAADQAYILLIFLGLFTSATLSQHHVLLPPSLATQSQHSTPFDSVTCVVAGWTLRRLDGSAVRFSPLLHAIRWRTDIALYRTPQAQTARRLQGVYGIGTCLARRGSGPIGYSAIYRVLTSIFAGSKTYGSRLQRRTQRCENCKS